MDESLASILEGLTGELRLFRLKVSRAQHRAESDEMAATLRVPERINDLNALLLVIRESLYGMASDLRDVASAAENDTPCA